jgi:diacylglycerol kinase family enzyme
MPAIAVIYNPNSRKNRRAPPGRPDRLRRILGPSGEVFETRAPDELGPVVGRLLEQGVDYLVSDGGDGSLHWAMNEMTRQSRARSTNREQPALLPTNGGTIDFVARKVGITGNSERIVLALTRALASQKPPDLVRLDSMEITGIELGPDGRELPFRRVGFSLAAGGIGQRFFGKYYAEPVLGARGIARVVVRAVGAHVGGALGLPLPERALAYGREVFRPTRARVVIDGREVPSLEHGAIHAGALDIELGGVFKVFPLARSPGILHFQAGALSPPEIIRALPDLWRGGAIQGEHLVEVGGVRMSVEALDEPLYPIIDGESFGPLKRLEVRLGPEVSVPRVSA